jgi:hypothetical protein
VLFHSTNSLIFPEYHGAPYDYLGLPPLLMDRSRISVHGILLQHQVCSMSEYEKYAQYVKYALIEYIVHIVHIVHIF